MLDKPMVEKYTLWRERALDDPDLTAELAEIENDEEEIRDRFYRELEFGTGGLRGVLGAGDNRMNVYTVRRARGWRIISTPGTTGRRWRFPTTAGSNPTVLPGKPPACWRPTALPSICSES